MPPELQGSLVYWPALAMVGAFIAAVFAGGWLIRVLKSLGAAFALASKNRKDLDEMRAASREQLAAVEKRRAEMEKLNESARRLFWQVEKTWIG
jgi:hypothetical protein